MKYFLLSSIMLVLSCGNLSETNTNDIQPIKSFYNLKAKDIEGTYIPMSDYKDKKILIVNVASKCGYTPQYKSLQELYETYKDNLYILAFPSNDFLGQEPGTNKDIKNFCEINFGVQFDIFEKISVKGSNIHPVYNWLSDKKLNGWNNNGPTWNFSKYLIDKDGNLAGYWGASIAPQSEEIVKLINK